MAGLPPPPLPPGGPPPPLPMNSLPPPPLPQNGPPMIGRPGPPGMRPGGGGGGGGLPFTTTVLITGLPSFLHSFRSLRQWMFPCGSIRTVIFYPRPSRGDDDEEDVDGNGNDAKKKEKAPKKVTALVTVAHPDIAVKFLASFQEFSSRLDDRYNAMQAYMVPASPDVPLPPPVLDAEAKKVLGGKLWENFVSLEGADVDGSLPRVSGGTTTGKSEEEGKEDMTVDESGNAIKIDVTKVAAAAGGGFDPDDDPLNAPHVLEAVKIFRRKLAQTQTTDQKRRVEIVAAKLKEMRPKIQAIVAQEKEQQRTATHAGGLHPPPLPAGLPPPNVNSTSLAGLPPPPVGLPPPPSQAAGVPQPSSAIAGAGIDSGKRGRSNLPAWMTEQKQTQESENTTADGADTEPPVAKKQKVGGSHPTNFPSALPASTHEPLKQFLTKQVEDSLGEADNTLIDFLYGHILGGKQTSELLEELQVVLEDEANGFLDAVWAKVMELQP